jgi:transaldolase
MEIWLDSSDIDYISKNSNLGILQGITTNPTILSLSKICPEDLIKYLLKTQEGLIAVQVLSDDLNEMYKEAKNLSSISERIFVKIPATQNGIRTIYALKQEGISSLATAIFEPRQALLAFKAGASYLAPYLGRIADAGKDPIQVLTEMHSIKLNYGFSGKIMGAGIRDLATALKCLEVGICAVTLPEKIFAQLIEDSESTLFSLKKFSLDWSKSIFSKK